MEPKDHQKKILNFVLEQNQKSFIEGKPRTVPELEYPDELAYYPNQEPVDTTWEKLRESIATLRNEALGIKFVSTSEGCSSYQSNLRNALFAERYSNRTKIMNFVHDDAVYFKGGYWTPGMYDQMASRAQRESKTPRILPMDFERIEKRIQAQLPAGKFLYPYMSDGYRRTGKEKSTLAITQMLIECLKIAEKQNGPLLNPITNVLQGMYGSNKPKSMHTEV